MGFALLVTGNLISSLLMLSASFSEAADAKASASPSRIVAGQILDSNGKPARGALVVWSLGLNRGVNQQDCVQGMTDANGNFRLQSPAGYLIQVPNFPDDRIWVRFPGHDILTTRATDAEIAPGERTFWKGNLQPPSGEIIRVQVLDPQRHAIQGELVELSQVVFVKGHGMVPQAIREQTSAVTDENGIAMLKGYPKDWKIQIVNVVSEKYGSIQAGVRDGGSGASPIVVNLNPAGRLEGHIKPLDGHPLAGIRVGVVNIGREENGPIAKSSLGRGFSVCETDRQGRFVVSAIAAGQLVVRTSSPATATAMPITPTLVTLEPEMTATVELVMQSTVAVIGRVVLVNSNEPVPNADVELRSANGQVAVVRTDQNGDYRAKVPPGLTNAECTVMVEPGTFSSVQAKWNEMVAGVDVKDGQEFVTLPPLELRGMIRIDGRVTDKAGSPVRRKRIVGMEMSLIHGTARTDDEGRFRMYCPADKRVADFELRVEGQPRPTTVSSRSPLELTVAD